MIKYFSAGKISTSTLGQATTYRTANSWTATQRTGTEKCTRYRGNHQNSEYHPHGVRKTLSKQISKNDTSVEGKKWCLVSSSKGEGGVIGFWSPLVPKACMLVLWLVQNAEHTTIWVTQRAHTKVKNTLLPKSRQLLFILALYYYGTIIP